MADHGESGAPSSGSSSVLERTDAVVGSAADSLKRLGRSDLADRLTRARNRMSRTQAVICVVGEFKQGKSALVNALCGAAICPVDDDVATAVPTWIHAALEPTARVRLVDGDEHIARVIAADHRDDYIREDGSGTTGHRVELVEVGHPSPVLQRGIGFVDMPGSGGIQSGRSASILGFLPDADGLIFVTDASAELSESELVFLRRAAERCPAVLVALTKIDLYAHWRRIVEIDAAHLQRWGIDAAAIVPVSADLRAEALRRADADLNMESGIPGLLGAIRGTILDRRTEEMCRRVLDEAGSLIIGLAATGRIERDALADPSRVADLTAELNEARKRTAALRKSGSRWSTALNDGFADLVAEHDQLLRNEVRLLLREVDGRLEKSDPATVWRALVADVQRRVGDLAANLSTSSGNRSGEIARRIAAIIGDTAPDGTAAGHAEFVDIAGFWDGPDDALPGGATRSATVLAAIRGGSSGVVMLGIVGSLAGLALASPVALGVGFVFGAKQLMEDRHRQAEMRRREARTIIQQYLRQVQVELGTHDRRTAQEALRALRDHFTERIAELDRISTETVATMQTALQEEQVARQRRLAYLQQTIADLDALILKIEDLVHETAGNTT